MPKNRRVPGQRYRRAVSANTFIGPTSVAGSVIAGDQIGSPRGQPGVPRPRQLPADLPAFQGRQIELAQLDRLMVQGRALPTGAPNLLVVTGAAGTGKTTLAVHWAHDVAGQFSDGTLYLDLQGYTPGQRPLRPLTALHRFLRALGVSAAAIPAEEQECEARYRSEMADRRMLVVLDNAHSLDQVQPLLPANRDCLVLVTSRESLTELAGVTGRSLELTSLTEADAVAVISARAGGGRVAAEQAATDELAKLCGRLPLALTIASAKIAASPEQSIAEYVNELAHGDRLSELISDADPHIAVRVAFDVSYRSLASAESALFGRLGLLPGQDFSLYTAAAVSGRSLAETKKSLRRLAAAHLIERTVLGRYKLHDLIRLFAAECARLDADRGQAEAGLYRWCVSAVGRAVQMINAGTVCLPRGLPTLTTELPDLPTRESAFVWLDAEVGNLVAAVEQADEHGHYQLAYWLADALRGFFSVRRTIPEWQRAAAAGLHAARQAGDRRAEAALVHSLGQVDWCRGRYTTSLDHLAVAEQLSDETDWKDGAATAENSLATVYFYIGKFGNAAAHYERAIALCRETGLHSLEAGLITNLGRTYLALGTPEKAIECSMTGLRLNRAAGGLLNVEAGIRGNLGHALCQLGRLNEAVEQLTIALRCCIEAGTRSTEASVRDLFAMTYLQLGEYSKAAEQAASARTINAEINDPPSQADNLVILAGVYIATGRYDAGLGCGHEALALYQDAGGRRGEVEALNALGQAQHGLGRLAEASDCHQRALQIARETGFRYGEVEALCGLASTYLASGAQDPLPPAREALGLAQRAAYMVLLGQCRTILAEIDLAQRRHTAVMNHCREALRLYRHSGCRLGLAQALRVLGTSLSDTGRTTAAIRHWRNATNLLDGAATPEQEKLKALYRRHGIVHDVEPTR